VRQPINSKRQQPPSRLDQILPPFSAKRYIAIWALVMIPLVAILFVLTQGNNKPAASSTNVDAYSTSTAQAANQVLPAATTGAGSAQSVAGGPGKYMVIDTAKGQIVAKLHTEAEAKVPNTITNFEKKAAAGYFNGLNFHRVEDWVIQGGDPQGNGTGGGTMPSEYNQLPFKAGALGVARGQDPALNNDSQFFITKSDATYLDGQYTNFGQVTEGMDVVNKIAIGDKINKITVENR